MYKKPIDRVAVVIAVFSVLVFTIAFKFHHAHTLNKHCMLQFRKNSIFNVWSFQLVFLCPFNRFSSIACCECILFWQIFMKFHCISIRFFYTHTKQSWKFNTYSGSNGDDGLFFSSIAHFSDTQKEHRNNNI